MKLTIALVAWAFLATGMSVKAQSGRNFGNGTLPEFLKPYDANKDGTLSAEEREAARKGRIDRMQEALDKWDTDGDGKLSPTEIEAARKAARDEVDAIRKQRFLDADKDLPDTPGYGFLSLAEFTAMIPPPPEGAPPLDVTRMFNFLDADKDGQISLAEFLSPCPKPPPPPDMPPLMRLPLFAMVDTNADKVISPEEFAAFIKKPMPGLTDDQIAAMFAKLDTNTDIGITPDEWPVKDPLQPPPTPPAPQPLPAFVTADKNGDKVVDPREFGMAACASHIPSIQVPTMFRAADVNHDFRLDATEYASIPAPPPPPTTP